MQGCSLRCLYCHNADTWKMKSGKEITVQEIIDEVLDYMLPRYLMFSLKLPKAVYTG